MAEPKDLVAKLWCVAEKMSEADQELIGEVLEELEQLRAELGAIDKILGRTDGRRRLVVLREKIAAAA